MPEPLPNPAEDEYAPMDLSGGVPLLSLLLFAAAASSRYLVGLLPLDLRPFPRGAMLSAFAVPVLASLGLLVGMLGLRSPSGRSFARLGVFLNAVALGVSLLLLAAFYWILPD